MRKFQREGNASTASYRVFHGRYAKGGKLTTWDRATVPAPAVRFGAGRNPIVPLVSSGVPGPLGLLHLPRLWMEALLGATGRLDPAFAGGREEFDDLLCDVVGVDAGALRCFLTSEPFPNYLATEAWLQRHAQRLDVGAIAQANNAIRKAAFDGTAIVLLDDLRAWSAVHDRVSALHDAAVEPIVPAISSRTAGAAGIDHLPRLWLKNVLKARGALPYGFRAGAVRIVASGLAIVPGGLDAATCEHIGLSMGASAEFIEATLPDYPAYEAWVLAHARRLDAQSLARHNATRGNTRPHKAAAEKAYVGWQGASNWNYLIDDLIDWKLLHDVVTRAELPAWTRGSADRASS